MSVVVLGSGMAGLGASWRLRQEGAPHALYDANPHPGGHTASHQSSEGFIFDEGPHISFTKDTRIQDLFSANVGGDYQVINAKVNNYWQGHWVKHPAQCNLHGLPTDLVVKIITDMIARDPGDTAAANYKEWLYKSFGPTFAETFPMQYGRKYHTVDAARMSTDWLGPRLYQPTMEEVLTGALNPSTPDVHYITEFRYPTHGGFSAFLMPFVKGADLRLNHRLVALDPRHRRLTFESGAEATYDELISSIPLPELIRMMPDVPVGVREAAATLACSTCVVVNVGVDRPDISDWHWTYFYDDDMSFSRLSFPHMLSPRNAPDGCGSIQAEVYYSSKYKPVDQPLDAVVARVIEDLQRCGLLRPDDRILFRDALFVKYANVIFDLDRVAAVGTVHRYLDQWPIHYCGRYGHWGYQWTDEAFKSGEEAAAKAIDRLAQAGRGVS